MNALLKNYKFCWFLVFCLAAILLIIACNVWLLCCGHCVVSDFLRIPMIGWVIIVANLVAGAVLWSLKHRPRMKPGAPASCQYCHVLLREGWSYCPNCGEAQFNLS